MFLRHKKAIETCTDEKKDERCRDLTIKVNVVSVEVARVLYEQLKSSILAQIIYFCKVILQIFSEMCRIVF